MTILFILAIIIFLIQIFFTLNVKIEVDNLKFSIPKVGDKYTNEDSKVLLKLYILKKIKIAQIDLKKANLNNEKFKNRIQQNIKEEKYNINVINFLRDNSYILEKMNLEIIVGTEDAAITAIGVGIISTIVGNVLRKRINNIENQKFKIIPMYQNKNILKIKFKGIFTFNIVNIMNMIKYIKRRVDKNGRTSYRRSYAYSNE